MLKCVILVFASVLAASTSREIAPVPDHQLSARGRAMFAEYCAACHGPTGRGDGPMAATLRRWPTDLTQLSRKNGGVFPVQRVFRFIKGSDELAAHGTREMPIWGYVFGAPDLNDPEVVNKRILNLERYIESLQVP